MNSILYTTLTTLARTNQLAAYSDVSPLLGLSMDISEHRDEIATMLTAIAIHEYKSGRPMLTALIVHRGDDNTPGEGFFSIAEQLGLYDGSRNPLQRLTFWANQVRNIYNHWS